MLVKFTVTKEVNHIFLEYQDMNISHFTILSEISMLRVDLIIRRKEND